MATELPTKLESDVTSAPAPAPVPEKIEAPVDPPVIPETKADDPKPLAVVESILFLSLFSILVNHNL
ncbi:hypothetical protein Hanom_Chr04g00367961 [Helianthus anomalus]